MADNIIGIHYSSRALSDSLEIKNYLLYKFAEREVAKFYQLLEAFENVVSKFPELYPKSSKSKNVRRAVLSRQLSIFYKVTANTIVVVAILDNRMDTAKWPK